MYETLSPEELTQIRGLGARPKKAVSALKAITQAPRPGAPPESVNLLAWHQLTPVKDQKAYGFCVGNAVAGGLEAFNSGLFSRGTPLSAAGCQTIAKEVDGDPGDQGTWAEDVLLPLSQTVRVPSEADMPYAQWAPWLAANLGKPMPAGIYLSTEYDVDAYGQGTEGLPDLATATKQALAANGNAFVAFSCTYGFDFPIDGRVTLAGDARNPMWNRGGHENCLAAYTPEGALFRNSWGMSWGGSADGSIPPGYALVEWDWFAKNVYDLCTASVNVTKKLRGDVEGGPRITIADVLQEMRWAVGLDHPALTPFLLRLADLTGDGKVTLADAVKDARLAVGLNGGGTRSA